jgi:hypothetical protein
LFFKLSKHGARGWLTNAQVLSSFMQVPKRNKMLHQNQMSEFDVREREFRVHIFQLIIIDVVIIKDYHEI